MVTLMLCFRMSLQSKKSWMDGYIPKYSMTGLRGVFCLTLKTLLSSHFSENVINLCEANSIVFVCLRMPLTLNNPLEVVFFRPF